MVTIIDLISGEIIEESANTETTHNTMLDDYTRDELPLQIIEAETSIQNTIPADLTDVDAVTFVQQQK